MKRIVLVLLMTCCSLVTMSQDIVTRAQSTSQKWKGFDISEIPVGTPSDTIGKKFYLYNVGTDRFIIDGGDWGMEGRLFHEDFGRCMLIKKDANSNKYFIQPGVQEKSNNTKRNFICNVPGVSRNGTWETSRARNGGFSITTILDGDDNYKNWIIERVETDPSSEFHTYRMYQQFNKKYQDNNTHIFRLGAVYGEWCSDGTTVFADGSLNKKGCGYYVHIDDDRSCWTTAGQSNNSEVSPYNNQTIVSLDDGDHATIDELYQWRFISEEEFIEVLNSNDIGINPSISSLVPDRDFTRNAQNFFNTWEIIPGAITPGDNEGRYGHTFGNCAYRTPQSKYNNEPWNSPVMLKKVWDDRENAKFGFMSFEGIGSAQVTIQLPKPGWYQVNANAISFGPTDHTTTMYAYQGNLSSISEPKTARNGFGSITLKNVYDPYTDLKDKYEDVTFNPNKQGKCDSELNISVGKVLTFHSEDYKHSFWVYIDSLKYNEGGDYKNLTLGIKKDYATKSNKNFVHNDSIYYYDKDWIVIDDIQISYMGLAPVFFYDTKENLDYLVYEQGKENEKPFASPDYRYSGAVNLVRSLNKDMWNTLSLPIPLTGEQVRTAFGDYSVLLKLHSIGGLSHNERIIDFKTVQLRTSDPSQYVIEPGELYMIKPSIDPIAIQDPFLPLGNYINCYLLGRNFFSVNTGETNYQHYIMDPSKIYNSISIPSWNGEESTIGGNNDGQSFVSYVQTPSYNKFRVNSNGNVIKQSKTGYDLGIIDNTYATKGSYVMSKNQMYEINRDTPLKGFRGWITLDHSIFDSQSQNVKMSINGIVDSDEQITTQINQNVTNKTFKLSGVYDITGRKVSEKSENLSRGLYIINGKKIFIR